MVEFISLSGILGVNQFTTPPTQYFSLEKQFTF